MAYFWHSKSSGDFHNLGTRSFTINYEQITEVNDIKNQILGSTEFIKKLFKKCQEGEFYEEAKYLLFLLCTEELEEYGVNPMQVNCRFGTLVEGIVYNVQAKYIKFTVSKTIYH